MTAPHVIGAVVGAAAAGVGFGVADHACRAHFSRDARILRARRSEARQLRRRQAALARARRLELVAARRADRAAR